MKIIFPALLDASWPLIIGIVLLMGIIFKWKFLIDPPVKWASLYSYAWIKKKFGKEALLSVNWLVSIGIIIFGFFYMLALLQGKVK